MEILLFFMETAIVDYSNNNRVSYHHLQGFWQNIFFWIRKKCYNYFKIPMLYNEHSHVNLYGLWLHFSWGLTCRTVLSGIVCKEKESTAHWIPRFLPSFIISNDLRKKQNLPFSKPRLHITLFFVPNSSTAPLPSLVFLGMTKRKRGRKKCIVGGDFRDHLSQHLQCTQKRNCRCKRRVHGGPMEREAWWD